MSLLINMGLKKCRAKAQILLSLNSALKGGVSQFETCWCSEIVILINIFPLVYKLLRQYEKRQIPVVPNPRLS